MTNYNQNLLVLFKTWSLDEKSIEQEVECLQKISRISESPEQFCTAHELLDRNRITSRKNKILKMMRSSGLPAFRFFINKN